MKSRFVGWQYSRGSGRRREWSPDEKARIVAESYEASVSAVARRYALSPQQLVAWRPAARQPLAASTAPEPLFVPGVVTTPPPEPVLPSRPARPRKRKAREAAVIEIEIDGVAMRVGRSADAKTVAVMIRALKATS